MLRWGLLSTAAINADVLPGLHRSATAEVIAVASRDPEKAKRFSTAHDIPRAYGSYAELLADADVQCIYLPLPNALHGQWVRRSLEAGKHVLCEKPLTPTAAEAADLFSLAERRGLVLEEAFMYRHHPKIKTARALIEAGRIGTVETIRSSFAFPTVDPTTDVRYSKELAGGALLDVGCYCVSLSTYLTDEAPASGWGHAARTPGGVDERFYGTLVFPGGAVAQFDCGIHQPDSVGASVLGSAGELVIAMPWYAHDEPRSVELRAGGRTEEVPTPGDNAYALEIEDFGAAVRGERPPEIPAAETIRNLEAINLLERAAGLG